MFQILMSIGNNQKIYNRQSSARERNARHQADETTTTENQGRQSVSLSSPLLSNSSRIPSVQLQKIAD